MAKVKIGGLEVATAEAVETTIRTRGGSHIRIEDENDGEVGPS